MVDTEHFTKRPFFKGFNDLRQNTDRLNAAIDRLDLGRNR